MFDLNISKTNILVGDIMEEKQIDLENCGENNVTTVFLKNVDKADAIEIATYPLNRSDYHGWKFNEIVELLNDGMRYRLMKKAEKLRKELPID
jgi:hypothetical protein